MGVHKLSGAVVAIKNFKKADVKNEVEAKAHAAAACLRAPFPLALPAPASLDRRARPGRPRRSIVPRMDGIPSRRAGLPR